MPLERRGVSLEWLVEFVNAVQEEDQVPGALPSFMNVHSFVEHVVKPLTNEIQAPLYALVPEEHVGLPDVFVSHVWNALLVGPARQRIGTMDALAEPYDKSKPTYVWLDFVSYNQHLFETVALDIQKVISEIGRLGFVATPVPLLNRTWCLWELLCSEATGKPPEIFIRPGFRNDKILSVNALFRSFEGVEQARASVAQDQAEITQAFLRRFGTLAAANAHIETMIREKLSADYLELHERDEDLRFRPYPWAFDQGTDETGKAAGIEEWRDFEPYYLPELRRSRLHGSQASAYDSLIVAGIQVPQKDRVKSQVAHASPNDREALLAAGGGDTARLRQLLATGFDVDTPLLGIDVLTGAAGQGQLESVRQILAAGANPDGVGTGGISPMRIAADKGHLEVVRLLVERGGSLDATSPDGCTALLFASSSGHATIAAYLLVAGSDPNLPEKKRKATPLHLAAAKGHALVVGVLLAGGADADAKAGDLTTPLFQAVRTGHAAIARALLDHGARASGAPAGVSMRDVAQKAGFPDDLLQRLG